LTECRINDWQRFFEGEESRTVENSAAGRSDEHFPQSRDVVWATSSEKVLHYVLRALGKAAFVYGNMDIIL
jgi:hypothetical protein